MDKQGGRKKLITGNGKGVHKRGSGLGTGPVGRKDGYSGLRESSSGGSRPIGGGSYDEETTRSRGGGSMLVIIIIAAVVLLGGGGAGLAYRGGTHRPLACDGTDLLRPPMGRALSAGLSGTLSGDTPLTRPDR